MAPRASPPTARSPRRSTGTPRSGNCCAKCPAPRGARPSRTASGSAGARHPTRCSTTCAAPPGRAPPFGSISPQTEIAEMTDRWEVPDSDEVRQILSAPPAPGLRFSSRPLQRIYFRDVYFDTPEGELRQRGARCRVRFASGGGCELVVTLPDGSPPTAPARGTDPAELFAGHAAAGRQLRALVEPARVSPWLELEVERAWRTLSWRLVPLPACDVTLETVVARRGEFTARTH